MVLDLEIATGYINGLKYNDPSRKILNMFYLEVCKVNNKPANFADQR